MEARVWNTVLYSKGQASLLRSQLGCSSTLAMASSKYGRWSVRKHILAFVGVTRADAERKEVWISRCLWWRDLGQGSGKRTNISDISIPVGMVLRNRFPSVRMKC